MLRIDIINSKRVNLNTPSVVRTSPYYIIGMTLRSSLTVSHSMLKGVYGIGKYRIREISRICGIVRSRLIGEININRLIICEDYIKRIYIVVGADRKRQELDNIYSHVNRGTCRGIKLRNGLPVRGQRTSSNAKTARKRNSARVRI